MHTGAKWLWAETQDTFFIAVATFLNGFSCNFPHATMVQSLNFFYHMMSLWHHLINIIYIKPCKLSLFLQNNHFGAIVDIIKIPLDVRYKNQATYGNLRKKRHKIIEFQGHDLRVKVNPHFVKYSNGIYIMTILPTVVWCRF
jgi:hypothetical protein